MQTSGDVGSKDQGPTDVGIFTKRACYLVMSTQFLSWYQLPDGYVSTKVQLLGFHSESENDQPK